MSHINVSKKAKKLKRNYTQATIKQLFTLSYNRCAFPGCENEVVVSATEKSDSIVLNHICHIYSLSEDGPRGRNGLTEKELNAPENLILFCPTHHVIVDRQHETYPAGLLLQWRQDHEESMRRRVASKITTAEANVFSHSFHPVDLIDQRIDEEVIKIRRARFFIDFDAKEHARTLALKLIEGEYSGGSNRVRGDALAWCARILSRGDLIDLAKNCLDLATSLSGSGEVSIAAAFISAADGEVSAALDRLAQIDTAAARGAALMIVGHDRGAKAALEWLGQSGTAVNSLNADGKFITLSHQFTACEWNKAYETSRLIDEREFDEAPVLIHAKALAELLQTVPAEFRETVSIQVPIHCAEFPWADDESSLEHRRVAAQKFTEVSEIAREFECPKAASNAEEYALWLELRDPQSRAAGRNKLLERLRSDKATLRLVPLGLQFGLDLDLNGVEQEIEREIARHGGMTLGAAKAQFALIFRQKTPGEAADYIARHRDQLSKFFDDKSLRVLEIDLLAKSGQTDQAAERLEALSDSSATTNETERLRERIAEFENNDPIGLGKKRFAETDSLNDLGELVDALERDERWNELCEYGEILFERTRSGSDAERYVTALSNSGRSSEVTAFRDKHPGYFAQSQALQMLYCWALYFLGEFVQARDELGKLDQLREHPNYRALFVNLAVGMGDWNSLSTHLARESTKRNERSARELIHAAQLAIHLSSPYAKELLFAAAEKAGDNAEILAAAYYLASSAGWEDDPDVHQWLEQAAAHSAEDGPIQKMSVQDILDRKPDWDRHESKTWRLYSRGELPAFIAAKALNRTLVQLFLQPALFNQSESDTRRKGVVPFCSGQRQPILPALDETVGFDGTALLTLAFLDLLEVAFDAVKEVYLPHSTLTWLFEEKQKASFHQPSRIQKAHRLRGLIATGALKPLSSTTTSDSDLAAQVGDSLASLIAEAVKESGTADRQCVVVRPSPVHRIGSLMQEYADLSAHANILSNCGPIIDKLREKGQITAEAANRASKYLNFQETPWPNQPKVSDDAILYLDDLAVSHFLHLGLLGKLKNAGFEVIVSQSEIEEANQLISYESVAGEVTDAIERIRRAVHRGIESGKVRIGEKARGETDETADEPEHPSMEIFSLAATCRWLVVDDRVLNQYMTLTHGADTCGVACSVDLLHALNNAGRITDQSLVESKTRMRQGGYQFIYVDEGELKYMLRGADTAQDQLVETAELKAIRENLLLAQLSNWLQLPKEGQWLDRLLKAFIKALRDIWTEQTNYSMARAVSEWLLERIDVRDWAHCLSGDPSAKLATDGRLANVMLLMSLPTGFDPDAREQYWDWIEERLVEPMKAEEPEFFQSVLKAHKHQIAELAEDNMRKLNG